MAAMGNELGELFSMLWQELSGLYVKWHQYVALFGTTPERIELMNRVAPKLTYTIQKTLWRDILIHLSRLTDPAETKQRGQIKPNLSINRLAELLKDGSDYQTINDLEAKAKANCEFARDWRNRVYAHRDLDIATNQHCTPLAHASRASVKNALEALADLLNRIARNYKLPTTLFDFDGTGAAREAEHLIHVISYGLDAQTQVFAKIRNGELTWKDVHKPT